MLNRPHTKRLASCLLNKERDWLNDDFFFLLHGDTSKSHSKHHNRRKSKHSQNGQASQKIRDERTKQAASPASYSTCFSKPTKKNIEEKEKLKNECFFPPHTSKCFFLTQDKQEMKSYAASIKSTKTKSSPSNSTRAQIPSTLNKQSVGKSYSGATKSTTKISLPNNSQAQPLSTGLIATQKTKSYTVATKSNKTASHPSRVQVSCSSGKSNSNGKGKKNAHRTGSNQPQTNNETNGTLKSSGKKWSRPPNTKEGTFKQECC